MWSKKPTPVLRAPAPVPDRPSVSETSVSPVLRSRVGRCGASRLAEFSTQRAIEAAWAGKPSACAIGTPARASAGAASLRRTSAIRRRKWRTLRPEAKRAAPSVGSVWFEPAT